MARYINENIYAPNLGGPAAKAWRFEKKRIGFSKKPQSPYFCCKRSAEEYYFEPCSFLFSVFITLIVIVIVSSSSLFPYFLGELEPLRTL